MVSTKDKVQGFFAGVSGEQGSDQPALLPTKTKDGAPRGNKWLMHLVEGDVEIRYTKADSHPYISYRAAVDEPADYEGRSLFGMLFFPRPVEDGDEEAATKYATNLSHVVGQVDAILGKGTCAELPTDSLESSLFELVPLLENVAFVGKIGLERGKKKDPEDEDKDAERFPDRNRISHFYHADTWEG